MVEVDRIKERAKAKNVSLKKIYRELELPQEYLRDVNAGKTSLSESRLEKIANYLDTTVEYLRGETDEKNIPLASKVSNDETLEGDAKLILQFYNIFSDEQKNKLMEEAFRIWKEEKN